MKCNFLKLSLIAIILSFSTNLKAQNKVIGFLGDWHTWSGSSYFTSTLQYDQLTDVVLAFVLPKADGTYSVGSDFFNQLRVLERETHARGKKIHISAGGWTASNTLSGIRLDPEPIQQMCYNEVAREKFVASMMDIVETYNLDGFNMDWEYPEDSDTDVLNALLRSLKLGILDLERKLNKEIEFSIAVSANSFNSNAYNRTSISYVDYVYIMAFDNAAQNHSTVSFAESAMDFWLGTKSLKPEKMILAIPFYSKGTSSPHRDYKTFSSGDPAGYYNDSDGSLNGYEYNSRPVLERKIEELLERGGQGVFVWELWGDRTDEYSLLSVLYANLVGSDEIKQELAKVKVYPNPIQDLLQIDLNSTVLQSKEILYSITDITGKQIQKGTLSAAKNAISTANISNKGLYFVTVSEGSNQATYKLVKK